ncbi:MAG: hypothetical protein ABID64_03180 [Nitrospirota bacterium]
MKNLQISLFNSITKISKESRLVPVLGEALSAGIKKIATDETIHKQAKSEKLKKATKQKLSSDRKKLMEDPAATLTIPKTPQKKTPSPSKDFFKSLRKAIPLSYNSFSHFDGEKGLKKLIDLRPKGFFLNTDKLKKEAPNLFEKLFNYALEKLKARDLFNASFFRKLEKVLIQTGKAKKLEKLRKKRKLTQKVLKHVSENFLKRSKKLFTKITKELVTKTEMTPTKRRYILKTFDKEMPLLVKRNLLKDISIQNFYKISHKWLNKFIPSDKNSDRKKSEFIIRIARNLYLEKKSINKQNVQNEYLDIIASQKQNEKTTIYQKRNIIFLANNEKSKNGQSRFRNPAIISSIRTQGGILPENKILMGENNKQDLLKKKNNFLTFLSNTKGPLTAHINAHGGPNAIYLSGGQLVNGKIGESKYDVKITYKEIANALIQRNKNFPQEKPPILIFDTCYNHTIMRKIYAEIKGKTHPPITIGASEYNQFSIIDSTNKYGSTFNQYALKMQTATKDNPLRIKDIIKNQYLSDTNVTIYVPTFQGKIKQIVEKRRIRRKKQLRLPGRPPIDETANV